MIDTREIHPLTDFLRNHKAHIARIKETRTPEVLTVNGRAELVLLDTESYEALMEQLDFTQELNALRAHVCQARNDAPPDEPITEAEIERSQAIVTEIMAETERLGLYRAEAERLGLNQ